MEEISKECAKLELAKHEIILNIFKFHTNRGRTISLTVSYEILNIPLCENIILSKSIEYIVDINISLPQHLS